MASKLAWSYSGMTNGRADSARSASWSCRVWTASRSVGVVRVDEDSRGDCDVVGVEPVDREGMFARRVEYVVDVVVVVDDHHREVAVACVGNRQCGTLRDVDDRAAVQRVAVLANDSLVVDRRWLAVMNQLVDAYVLREGGEHAVGFGAYEVVDVDVRGHIKPSPSPGYTKRAHNALMVECVSRTG